MLRRQCDFPVRLERLEARRLLAATPFTTSNTGLRAAISVESVRVISATPRAPGTVTRPSSEALLADASTFDDPSPVAVEAAAQTYGGALDGNIVYTSGGHGYEWNGSGYFTGRGDTWDVEEAFGNQEQMSFFADYVLRAGGTVVPMRPVGHQLNEVVLDNDSPGVTFSGPAWNNSSSSVYYDEDYGAGTADAVAYRFHSTTSGPETAVATYQPSIPQGGWYPVYTWALSGSNRTTQLYRINHTGGATEVRVDHRKVGRGWVYLGTYHFDTGSNAGGNVQISNNSPVAGQIIADAIRFGNGMGDYPDGPSISGKSREDEASLLWLNRAVGVGTSAATAFGTGNVSAPSNMAEWMNSNSNPFGTSVYIGFHSNAGGGRGAVGLIDADAADRTPNQAALALYTGRQINQDMQALNGAFEHNWSTRTTHTYTDQFGEIDLGTGAEMDATIIEVAFHDSQLDAELLRDPKVRDQLARSTYEATLEYFANFGGLTSPVSQPQAPQSFRASANAAGDITVSWDAPSSRTGGPGAATAYRVYTSRDGYGFANPIQVTGTSLTIPAAQLDGDAYYFKVAAINAGGESPGSAVVGARKNGAGGGGGTTRILVVNGFDRFDRNGNIRQSYPDGGTSYGTPNGYVERVRPRLNNSFDYVVKAGEAIEAYTAGGASLGFDSVQNEHVTASLLAQYRTVVWLAGEESTADETFSSTEQSAVSSFINGGGSLFVSGSEIGWDLDRPSGPTTGDRSFYNNTLKADYVADDAGTYSIGSAPAGSIFAGMPSFSFDSGSTLYDVDFPDVLAPAAGSFGALHYSGGTGGIAALQWGQPTNTPAVAAARVVNMAFPFETITSEARRNDVMARVLGFFQTAISETPAAPDLVAAYDTGSSNADKITNLDNSSAGKRLQFLVGNTVAGATVTVYADGIAIGAATAAAGTTTVTTNGTTDLLDGTRSITARQQEPDKAPSAASPALGVIIDTVAPVPTQGPDLASSSDTGASNTDNLTNDTTPTFIGGTVGAQALLISLYADGNFIGSTTTTVGNWSITSQALADGTYGITATVTDVAGNVSAASGPLHVTIDTAPPLVTDAFVAGSAWTQPFRDFLAASGQGDATYGYRLSAAQHADELPWINLNQL
ncbi:MAG TPA: Ig-like domain-containing protein, partial [Tepidisphaeraceae bacterium]|nr:Ig-like domain-containing protein [Tepidisphaeraceae bacterium]